MSSIGASDLLLPALAGAGLMYVVLRVAAGEPNAPAGKRYDVDLLRQRQEGYWADVVAKEHYIPTQWDGAPPDVELEYVRRDTSGRLSEPPELSHMFSAGYHPELTRDDYGVPLTLSRLNSARKQASERKPNAHVPRKVAIATR